MTREEVLELVRTHLADELDIDPGLVRETSRFKEDLNADSLHLFVLVQELDDTYGVKIPDEDAVKITTVGEAVDYVLAHAPSRT